MRYIFVEWLDLLELCSNQWLGLNCFAYEMRYRITEDKNFYLLRLHVKSPSLSRVLSLPKSRLEPLPHNITLRDQ
jgi:hypothetical protein